MADLPPATGGAPASRRRYLVEIHGATPCGAEDRAAFWATVTDWEPTAVTGRLGQRHSFAPTARFSLAAGSLAEATEKIVVLLDALHPVGKLTVLPEP